MNVAGFASALVLAQAWLFGVDVSAFQAQVNWAELFNLGFRFVYARCCEGLNLDAMHEKHILASRAAGFKSGSYQFGHPSMDVEALAKFFIAHAFFDQLRPVIDMESLATSADGKKIVPLNAGAWCLAWCKYVQVNTGVKPIVYASTSYMQTMLRQEPELVMYLDLANDFWDAEYHADGDYNPIKKPCVARQYQGNVHQDGIAGLADLDVLYSSTLAPLEVPDAAA